MTKPAPTLPGRRHRAWRNLVVAAINAGIEQRVFELDGTSPEGPRRAPELVYEFVFCGLPAVACAADVGFDELGDVSMNLLIVVIWRLRVKPGGQAWPKRGLAML